FGSPADFADHLVYTQHGPRSARLERRAAGPVADGSAGMVVMEAAEDASRAGVGVRTGGGRFRAGALDVRVPLYLRVLSAACRFVDRGGRGNSTGNRVG